VDAIANTLNCLPPNPNPEHTAGLANTQMDIVDIEEDNIGYWVCL
jgi:hypothetical protein